MILFLRTGEYKGIGEVLVREALSIFAAEEKGLPCAEDAGRAEILRMENGKPYFAGGPARFSVSHTGKLWACLMSSFEVGLDVQEIRPARFKEVAERIFLPEEQEFVEKYGELGFFRVWACKEACVKYFGTGIAKDFLRFSVIRAGRPAGAIELHGRRGFLSEVETMPGIRCAICSEEKDFKVWTKVLK